MASALKSDRDRRDPAIRRAGGQVPADIRSYPLIVHNLLLGLGVIALGLGAASCSVASSGTSSSSPGTPTSTTVPPATTARLSPTQTMNAALANGRAEPSLHYVTTSLGEGLTTTIVGDVNQTSGTQTIVVSR